MRSETTSELPENIVVLSDIRDERQRALSPYGPVKAGLTTLQRTERDQALMELHSSLEKTVADLNSKSYTVLDTLTIAIDRVRAALSVTTTDTGGTDIV